MRQATREGMPNLVLTRTFLMLRVVPDNPGDGPQNCKESLGATRGSCSKESRHCSVGGRRVTVLLRGLKRDSPSVSQS